jgi:hypothetical protein
MGLLPTDGGEGIRAGSNVSVPLELARATAKDTGINPDVESIEV